MADEKDKTDEQSIKDAAEKSKDAIKKELDKEEGKR